MVLENILTVLQSLRVGTRRAKELGRLGFMEWLASLPANSNVTREAQLARQRIGRLDCKSPATREFEGLIVLSTRPVLVPSNRADARARRRRN
ncbi:MAG: hypothetical protein ACFE0S_17295 [Rhodospirillales bacterium]